MPEPICPNQEVERLRDLVEDAKRMGGNMTHHNLAHVATILSRLHEAQAEGRVLPDPNDKRPWKQIVSDRIEADVASLMRKGRQA